MLSAADETEGGYSAIFKKNCSFRCPGHRTANACLLSTVVTGVLAPCLATSGGIVLACADRGDAEDRADLGADLLQDSGTLLGARVFEVDLYSGGMCAAAASQARNGGETPPNPSAPGGRFSAVISHLGSLSG